LGATGACYQEWNNLVVRPMVAEIWHRLGTNIFLLPLCVIAYRKIVGFCDTGYVILCPQPSSATDK